MADGITTEQVAHFDHWFAAECNNLAWDLAELPPRTQQQIDNLMDAAHAAAFHWARVGTELQVARSRLLLGLAHALAGSGETALRYAREAHSHLTTDSTPDWELALIHMVLAHAARAAGDVALYRDSYRQAQQLGDAIADAGDRDIFMASFRNLPAPSDEQT
jgi:hypothetical protein